MIQGEVLTFLRTLGAHEGQPELDRVLSVIGGKPTVETFVDGGVRSRYLTFADNGVDFLLTDGVVNTVFIQAFASSEYGQYDGWSTLIDGVEPSSSRDDIRQAFGEPVQSKDFFMTYEAPFGYLRFEFDGERLKMVVLMHELIGMAEQGDQPREDEIRLEGDLGIFMRAVGAPLFGAEHQAITALAGPAVESQDEKRDGADWAYFGFPDSGVVLHFKDEVMVGALIELVNDDGSPPYPEPERLVSGLPLPSSRSSIHEYFGAPEYSGQDADVYLVDGCYLRFDFDTDTSVSISVSRPSADGSRGDDTEAAEPIIGLLRALIDNMRGGGEEWASLAMVMEFGSDGLRGTYGYVYSAEGANSPVSVRPSLIESALKFYTDSHYASGQTLPVKMLLQFDRDMGEYEVTFEDTDAERWRVTPENLDEVRAELRPKFER